MWRVLGLLLVLGTAWPAPAGAEGMVALDDGIAELRRDGDVLWARTESGGWARIAIGPGLLVVQRTGLNPPPPPPLPPDALAGSRVGRGTGPIRRAWLAEPTKRYDHAVLGDGVEAGALVVETRDGTRHRLRLDDGAVFEDLTPRVADLDGDGVEEVVVVKSYQAHGAALAVAHFRADGTLALAESPPLGQAHRWLNPVGVGDLDGDGTMDIAVVETPHIGGTLRVYAWTGEGLVARAALAGFSNHVIGSPVLGLSAVADMTGDGRPELVVPDETRGTVKIVQLNGDALQVIETLAVPGHVALGLFVVNGRVAVGLRDGRLAVLGR